MLFVWFCGLFVSVSSARSLSKAEEMMSEIPNWEANIRHKCVHDEIREDMPVVEHFVKYPQKSIEERLQAAKRIKESWDQGKERRQSKRRLMSESSYASIRITPYWDSVEATHSGSPLQMIKQLVSASVRYYEKFTKVIPVEGRLMYPRFCYSGYNVNGYFNCVTGSYDPNNPTCGSVTIPTSHLEGKIEYSGWTAIPDVTPMHGVQNSDLIVYVSADESKCSGQLASAGACARDQYGRPTHGMINICASALADLDWAPDMEVVLHELTHIVIVSFSHFGQFYDWSKEAKRPQSEVVYEDTSLGMWVVKSPEVLTAARSHYGCNSAPGLPLENNGGGGTANSHWEDQHVFWETMNGVARGGRNVFTDFTFALMEDSGWYLVDRDFAEPYDWGKGAGCAWFNGQCVTSGNSNFPEFWCTSQGDRGCTYDNSFNGYCAFYTYSEDLPAEYQYFANPKQGGNSFAQYCPWRGAWGNSHACWDTFSSATPAPTQVDGEVYSSSSRCIDIRYTSNGYQTGHCYQLACSGWNGGSKQWSGVTITAGGGNTVYCSRSDAMNMKNVPSLGFNLKCPNIDIVCKGSQPFTCGQGFYSDALGKCLCHVGWKGSRCEDQDGGIEAGTVGGVINNPTYHICVSGSSSGIDGKYFYNGEYQRMSSYQMSGKFIWFDAWNHVWRITTSKGSRATEYSTCNAGEWPMDVNACNGLWSDSGLATANCGGGGAAYEGDDDDDDESGALATHGVQATVAVAVLAFLVGAM